MTWLTTVRRSNYPYLVAEAKRRELLQLKERDTFVPTRRSELPLETKVVGTRWVITNKGTTLEPKIKARLVCQEFATEKNMDLFSGTPALPAVKVILSDLVTDRRDRLVMVLDVTGALLYGTARRIVAVRLPVEAGASGALGLLRKSLYGLRDAPQIGNDHFSATLRGLGFTECVTVPGILRHVSRDIRLAVHVDDVIVTGALDNLQW